MRYYENGIYPIGLVLSADVDSVREEYWFFTSDGRKEEIPDTSATTEASTFVMIRKAEYRAIAIGIVFNKPIDVKLSAHEAFHATYFTMSQLGMSLDDCCDEAWAYYMGWVVECIEDFKNQQTA